MSEREASWIYCPGEMLEKQRWFDDLMVLRNEYWCMHLSLSAGKAGLSISFAKEVIASDSSGLWKSPQL